MQRLLESRMHIRTSGVAKIRHKTTGVLYGIPEDRIDWESTGGLERGMGPETQWVGTVHHDELGTLEWHLWEYPMGSESRRFTELNGHELEENYSINLEHDEEEPEITFGFDADANTGSAESAERMKQWFFRNYEDPANSLPYITAEGGYQWVTGGPYTSLEALESEFGREFSFDFIEMVADDIEEETGVLDWAPIPGPDFYDDGSDETVTEETEEEILSQRLPLVEELVSNSDTGVFSLHPQAIAKPDLYSATLGQIADAIEDVLAKESNGLNENSLAIRRLQRTLERYANDPQRVEMELTTVHASLTSQIASGELPPSDENEALLSALRTGALGIRAADPLVAENRKILQEQEMRELSSEASEAIAEVAPSLDLITEGVLKEQLQEDIRALRQEIDSGAPPLPGVTRSDAIIQKRDEATRVFGRTARILIALRKAPEIVHKLERNAGVKAVSLLAGLASLVSLGLQLFM
ncbi:hypothetical protein LHL23_23070 [Leisingera sp. McT4-56]|nr:hypothetical protein [Leisingera sp. McT4-56]